MNKWFRPNRTEYHSKTGFEGGVNEIPREKDQLVRQWNAPITGRDPVKIHVQYDQGIEHLFSGPQARREELISGLLHKGGIGFTEEHARTAAKMLVGDGDYKNALMLALKHADVKSIVTEQARKMRDGHPAKNATGLLMNSSLQLGGALYERLVSDPRNGAKIRSMLERIREAKPQAKTEHKGETHAKQEQPQAPLEGADGQQLFPTGAGNIIFQPKIEVNPNINVNPNISPIIVGGRGNRVNGGAATRKYRKRAPTTAPSAEEEGTQEAGEAVPERNAGQAERQKLLVAGPKRIMLPAGTNLKLPSAQAQAAVPEWAGDTEKYIRFFASRHGVDADSERGRQLLSKVYSVAHENDRLDNYLRAVKDAFDEHGHEGAEYANAAATRAVKMQKEGKNVTPQGINSYYHPVFRGIVQGKGAEKQLLAAVALWQHAKGARPVWYPKASQ